MFEKVKCFLKEKGEKLEKVATPMFAAGAAIGLVPTVYANDTTTATTTLDKTMWKIVELVGTIFRYIGILLALWGVGSLVMAFKNEDADSKSRAIMSIVVGVVLMFLETLVEPILKAAGLQKTV